MKVLGNVAQCKGSRFNPQYKKRWPLFSNIFILCSWWASRTSRHQVLSLCLLHSRKFPSEAGTPLAALAGRLCCSRGRKSLSSPVRGAQRETLTDWLELTLRRPHWFGERKGWTLLSQFNRTEIAWWTSDYSSACWKLQKNGFRSQLTRNWTGFVPSVSYTEDQCPNK